MNWFTPFRIFFHSFLVSLNIFLVLCLFASAYSDIISPEKYVLFASDGWRQEVQDERLVQSIKYLKAFVCGAGIYGRTFRSYTGFCEYTWSDE